MMEIFRRSLQNVEYMADVTEEVVPRLKAVSKERGGLGYVIGRWEPPWLDPDSSKNYWLQKHTVRIATRVALPVFSDLDIFSHPKVQSLMVSQDRMGETIEDFRTVLLTFGGITQLYALWGWSSDNKLIAALGTAYEREISIHDFPKKVDDPLLMPLPEELV